MKTTGGSAVASGGYACIFRPMIPCEKNIQTSENNIKSNQSMQSLKSDKYVSKLMLNKHAESEINEVLRFEKIIRNIPNYKKYFIFPKVACTPSKLSNTDKKNYDKQCTRLNKRGITSNNINQHLMNLSVLQIPDGGIDIHDFIDKNKITKEDFYKINKKLIELLKNAIIPMNNKKLYHLDLKAGNVLLDINNNHSIKLIDWGMSSYIQDKKNVVSNIGYRPFHFNMPYSIIIMNTESITHIEQVIYNSYSQSDLTIEIASELFERYFDRFLSKKLGDGHLEYIEYVSKILDDNSERSPYKEIFNYIGTIIVHFRKNDNTFNYDYFDVFMKNIDVWGFISIYLPFMDLDENFNSKHMRKLTKVIRKLYTDYLYKYITQPIPIDKLINFLESLNKQYYSISPNVSIAYVDTLLSKTLSIPYNDKYVSKSKTSLTRRKSHKSNSKTRKKQLI